MSVTTIKVLGLALLLSSNTLASPAESPIIAENHCEEGEEGRATFIFSRINGDIVCIEESFYTTTLSYRISYYYQQRQVITAHLEITQIHAAKLEQDGTLDYQTTQHILTPTDELSPITHGRKVGTVQKNALKALALDTPNQDNHE